MHFCLKLEATVVFVSCFYSNYDHTSEPPQKVQRNLHHWFQQTGNNSGGPVSVGYLQKGSSPMKRIRWIFNPDQCFTLVGFHPVKRDFLDFHHRSKRQNDWWLQQIHTECWSAQKTWDVSSCELHHNWIIGPSKWGCVKVFPKKHFRWVTRNFPVFCPWKTYMYNVSLYRSKFQPQITPVWTPMPLLVAETPVDALQPCQSGIPYEMWICFKEKEFYIL